jgi:hypothetical protein
MLISLCCQRSGLYRIRLRRGWSIAPHCSPLLPERLGYTAVKCAARDTNSRPCAVCKCNTQRAWPAGRGAEQCRTLARGSAAVRCAVLGSPIRACSSAATQAALLVVRDMRYLDSQAADLRLCQPGIALQTNSRMSPLLKKLLKVIDYPR